MNESWGDIKPGVEIKSIKDVKVGDVLLQTDKYLGAKDIVWVTKVKKKKGQFLAVPVNPRTKQKKGPVVDYNLKGYSVYRPKISYNEITKIIKELVMEMKFKQATNWKTIKYNSKSLSDTALVAKKMDANGHLFITELGNGFLITPKKPDSPTFYAYYDNYLEWYENDKLKKRTKI